MMATRSSSLVLEDLLAPFGFEPNPLRRSIKLVRQPSRVADQGTCFGALYTQVALEPLVARWHQSSA
jgi:hypothetical protein